jgi:hypothetical protein
LQQEATHIKALDLQISRETAYSKTLKEGAIGAAAEDQVAVGVEEDTKELSVHTLQIQIPRKDRLYTLAKLLNSSF